MDALRKTYHRAVQIPLENVETLWKDLDSFENGLNKITVCLQHNFGSTCIHWIVSGEEVLIRPQPGVYDSTNSPS